jgi:hypothetical protein
MGVAGGFEILGAFAGRFSCMELSEIEEACKTVGTLRSMVMEKASR